MALTLVRDGEKDWYSSGDINPGRTINILYIAEQPGVQRVYFENILSQNEDYQGRLYIEADHFGRLWNGCLPTRMTGTPLQ